MLAPLEARGGQGDGRRQGEKAEVGSAAGGGAKSAQAAGAAGQVCARPGERDAGGRAGGRREQEDAIWFAIIEAFAGADAPSGRRRDIDGGHASAGHQVASSISCGQSMAAVQVVDGGDRVGGQRAEQRKQEARAAANESNAVGRALAAELSAAEEEIKCARAEAFGMQKMLGALEAENQLLRRLVAEVSAEACALGQVWRLGVEAAEEELCDQGTARRPIDVHVWAPPGSHASKGGRQRRAASRARKAEAELRMAGDCGGRSLADGRSPDPGDCGSGSLGCGRSRCPGDCMCGCLDCAPGRVRSPQSKRTSS